MILKFTGRVEKILAGSISGVRQAFICSPMKSIRTAAREFEIPLTTVHKVLQKSFKKITTVCLQSANVTETSAK